MSAGALPLPQSVEFNPKSETIQAVIKESQGLWSGKTPVVAMGDLLTLGAFSLVPPIARTLVGAFSTEREALTACERKHPDLLYLTEHLEQGYGIQLARKVKQVSPKTRILLFLHRENQEVIRDALDASIEGIAFVSSIGQGIAGDFFQSLTAIANGSSYYPKDVREMAGFKKSMILNDLSAAGIQLRFETFRLRARVFVFGLSLNRSGAPLGWFVVRRWEDYGRLEPRFGTL